MNILAPVAADAAPLPAVTRTTRPGRDFAALIQQRTPTEAVARASAARAWEAAPNGAFRQRIAQAERSAEHAQNGYGVRNPNSGALGRYQFLPNTLVDIGWRQADGGWSTTARRQGVQNEADFLASPAAQEAAMSAYLGRVETQLHRNGAASRQGDVVQGINGQEIALTEGGMVAAAHRRGAGTVARWLQHRTATPDAPLSVQQRNAYAQVERRLQEFAAIAYASQRGQPAGRDLAATSAQGSAS